MTITGGIKFFERSSALYKDGTRAVCDYDSSAANNILTNNQRVYSQTSSANSDAITVTWTVTYNQTVTIDRIFLNRHNFREFTIQYDSSGALTDFTNVVGLDGIRADLTNFFELIDDNDNYLTDENDNRLLAQTIAEDKILETDFSDEVAYYEFDQVNTSSITITATKTQTANQEKILYNFFTTTELGTLEYPPQITPVQANRNPRQSDTLGGLLNSQKGFEVVAFSMDFTSHPSQADYDLIETLYDSSDSFLVWLCGGRRDTPYFRYTVKGYKLRDIYNMQTVGAFGSGYPGSIYVNAPVFAVGLRQSV